MNLLRSSLLRACFGAGAVVVAWSACASDGGGGPPVPTASSVAVDAGNNQVGTAGQALVTALSVIARDASSNPVSGVAVTWAAASGGGSVSPTTSSTNAGGIASTTRTLGAAAGTHTTTATVTGLAPVTFSAVGQIQGATQMALNAGNNQSDTVLATLAVPLAVVVRDQNSAAVAGVVVTWSATGGGSVLATSTTNASGVATISRILGATAGPQGAQATVTGLAGSPVTYTFTANAGNAAVLAKTAGDNQSVAPSSQVLYTVTTRDAHANPKSGVTIDWAVGAGGGSITPGSNVTGVNGTASATRTLGAGLGTQTATATAAGLGGSPATFTTTAVNVASVTVGGAATAFNPANVTIPLNGIVTWTWAVGNALPHNVTFAVMAGAPLNIPNTVTPGTAIDRTFTVAGTFMYQCTNHLNMNGQVTVTP